MIQEINRIEFYDRLKDIVLGFNNLTIEEKIKVLPEKIIDNIDNDMFKIERVEELERYFKN